MEFMKEIIVLLIGFGAGYWFAKSRFKMKKVVDEKQDKILELLRGKGELTNDDVEKAFEVSDATATRYLDKLEKEGKIVQIGKEGRFVKYRLK